MNSIFKPIVGELRSLLRRISEREPTEGVDDDTAGEKGDEHESVETEDSEKRGKLIENEKCDAGEYHAGVVKLKEFTKKAFKSPRLSAPSALISPRGVYI